MIANIIDTHNQISTADVELIGWHQLQPFFYLPELSTKLPLLMIWDTPGIGKSSIIRNITQEMGIGFVDMRLAQREPVATGPRNSPREHNELMPPVNGNISHCRVNLKNREILHLK